MLRSEEEEPQEPAENQQPEGEQQDLDVNFLRLLNQLREGQQGEGNGAEDENGMEDLIQRFMMRLQGAAPPNGPPSPQNALDEKMYQAARSGDLAEVQQSIQSGAQRKFLLFLAFSPFWCFNCRIVGWRSCSKTHF